MARAIVTQYGMSAELGTQVFGQPNHEVFLGRDYGNTQDYSEETAKRIDDEVARIMKDAHDRAYEILASHREQMDLMANVLERETVEGEACLALLDNTWDEYLKHEDGSTPARRPKRPPRVPRRASGRSELEGRAGQAGRPGSEPAVPRACGGRRRRCAASASSTSEGTCPLRLRKPPEQKGDGTER